MSIYLNYATDWKPETVFLVTFESSVCANGLNLALDFEINMFYNISEIRLPY